MIMASGVPEPGDGEDPDSLAVLIGLDEEYLENLRSNHAKAGPIAFPDGRYWRVFLFRGKDDLELLDTAGKLIRIDHRTIINDDTERVTDLAAPDEDWLAGVIRDGQGEMAGHPQAKDSVSARWMARYIHRRWG